MKVGLQVGRATPQSETPVPAIELDNVSRYFGDTPAVLGVNLAVGDAEFVTLLGPSGCGKTTTLRMVAGLEENSTGRIMIAGRVVSDADRGTFVAPDKRQLGMVFQSYAIWPHMTVFDNVAYPLRIRRRPMAEIKEKVAAALRLVEMSAYADRPAPALSGGQQQRVAIARALVFEPSVLLLDEPLSNLDAKLRTQMGDEFRALQQRIRIACLYVTHDQEEAMALSDRIVVMNQGRIMQVGAPELIYRRPANLTVAKFFGQPNILTARVVSCQPGGEGSFTVEVEDAAGGSAWRGQCRAASMLAPGEPALVVVRPEALMLGAGGGAEIEPELRFAGRVSHSIFRGARRSLTIETTAGVRLGVETPALGAPQIGDDVDVRVTPGGAWALADA